MHNLESSPVMDELTQILLEQSDHGIIIIHNDTAVDLNTQARRTLGYSWTEAATLTIQDIVPIGGFDKTLLQQNGVPIGALLNSTKFVRRKDHSFLRIDFRSRTLADGRIVLVMRAPTGEHLQEDASAVTLRSRAQNFRALADASHAFSQLSRDYHGVLDLVTRKLVELLGDLCSIRLLSDDEQWLDLVAIYGVQEEVAERFRKVMTTAHLHVEDQAHTHRIIQTGEPLLWPHITLEHIRTQAKSELVESLQQLGSHGLIIVPLRAQNRVMGILYLLRYLPHHQPFTQDDVSLVQNLADRASLSIVNARLYRDLQTELQRRQQAETLLANQNRVLEHIAKGLPLPHILDEIVLSVEKQIDGAVCSISELDQSGKHLYTASAPGLAQAYTNATDGRPIGPRAGSCGTAAYRRRPVIVSDIEQDPLWEEWRDLAATHGLRACWSFPIFSSKQKVLGTFSLYHRTPYAPSQPQQRLVARAADLAGVAMERDQTARSLRESEERFRALVDASAQIVWTHDANGHPLEDSPSWNAFTGQTNAGRRGDGWLDVLHPEDRERTARSWQEAVQSRASYTTEYRLRHASGEWRWMAVRAVPLHNEDGSVRAWVGMNTDITERRQTAERREQLEKQLHQTQKMESIGQLAGGVAHDFNNVLTVIQMYSDLLTARMSPDDPLRSKVQQIQSASQRASALTGQLLAFSRKQMLNPTVLNLNTLVTKLHSMLGRLIGEDILFVTSLESTPWSVVADPAQLEQVVLNLVVNARDAMPTGGRLTIATRNVHRPESLVSKREGTPVEEIADATCKRCVMLAVIDTGSGMDAHTQSRIFEPFFTTKSEGKHTGLGLSTAHGIIKQSGGEITVHSQPGKGSTFRIYLPATMDTPLAPHPEPQDDAVQRGGETVLLVEDEAAVCALVRDTLVEIGYNVLEARNGIEALMLSKQRTDPLDLLLTDVVMPNMSGRELAEQLQEKQPDLKVLFMSGYTDDAVVRHGVLTAEVDLLQKPFSAGTLAAKVRALLDRRTS